MRDEYQMHHYNTGEFGSGGLYHLPNGSTASTAGIEVKMHPNLPAQKANSVWTFDGTLSPKLLMARYGESILFRHYNVLPISVTENNGFGRNTISTHEHNGHNPAESDGSCTPTFILVSFMITIGRWRWLDMTALIPGRLIPKRVCLMVVVASRQFPATGMKP